MRVSDYIIKYLKEVEGIDTVFTVSGGGCIFLIDSLSNVEGLTYVATHHEIQDREIDPCRLLRKSRAFFPQSLYAWPQRGRQRRHRLFRPAVP